MSDCNVCAFSNYEGEPGEFCEQSMRTARKPHVCGECGKTIQPGERYAYAAGKSDGRMFTAKSCAVCDEIAEVITELNAGCFARLSTPEAKRELQRRWIQAKGLAA